MDEKQMLMRACRTLEFQNHVLKQKSQRLKIKLEKIARQIEQLKGVNTSMVTHPECSKLQ
ncbi:MAG TPA: hypothetical protein VM802_19060 [Chitinophaga sp.]|uniref:hypothetical protein n=1 Tax=Chitinophaga sp. TaxID=1869181 RepID=UPI002CEA692C|nr:hypothetical protein [Chitinophaga sp.]HVI46987.1 hypothetical protein [Chitinophaga sp.]